MKSYKISKLSKSINKLLTLLIDIFCNPIVVNACLHYDYGCLLHRNWGDDINVYLLKRIWNRPISYLYSSTFAMRKEQDNFIVIGSTLAMLSNKNSIVWGAGVIDENETMLNAPKKILSVRGPKTRKWLMDKGIDCPEVYGDPAMLLKYIYKPKKIRKRYKLGIIPHYDDYNHPVLAKMKSNPDILFIRMEGYKKWTDVIDQVASCDYIASSSLHGLIIAETYNIPNLWIEISGKLLGGHFKFHDFFLSIGIDRDIPFVIQETTTINDLLATKKYYKQGYIDLSEMKKASPFPLCI